MTTMKEADYECYRKRPPLLREYGLTMVEFLKRSNPNVPESEIKDFVNKTMKERVVVPDVSCITHPREGVDDVKTIPLTHYVKDVVSDYTLSPSGSTYTRPSVKESFTRRTILRKIKDRKVFKSMYLDFEAKGMEQEATFYNLSQNAAKYFNNSIPGGMKIKQFILGSKAGFNAITSVGRLGVKQAYSYIERFVAGNIYLPSVDDALTYVLNHIRYIHPDFEKALSTYGLYVPTTAEVEDYILGSLRNYTRTRDIGRLSKVIASLNPVERAYIYYAGSMHNLCMANDALMRQWVDDCFLDPESIGDAYLQEDLADLKKVSGDLRTAMLTVYYDQLGEHHERPGQWYSPEEAKEFAPDNARKFIYLTKHFTKHYEKLRFLLVSVFQTRVTFSRLTKQQRMTRRTVMLSDTDSNIFTLQELVRWRCHRVQFDKKAYELLAIMTFTISQCLEHLFARLSVGMGVELEDLGSLSMKNEFLYPVTLMTSLGKHYLAVATMQEGSLLPNPRKDIKGVNFRSSAWPQVIRSDFEKFVVTLFEKIRTDGGVHSHFVLSHIANMEKTVHKSIVNLEPTYLQTGTIKPDNEYKDPSKSLYFYYELWSEVFAEDFGEMQLPNKCFKIPLIGEDALFKSPAFMANLEASYPRIHQKLTKFMADRPGRDIKMVFVPPSSGKLHPFFASLMDGRSMIAQVMTAYYHLLDNVGLATAPKLGYGLVCDFFDPDFHVNAA